ncbi:MBG domain-containing protein [Limosilactobacillus reuteri]|nr:MBG domain-containing protein [Limosilactobacillus reuteri]MDD1401620.1 MBG domain-containing protein [Limosilactobacillus reuteri]
MGGSALFEIKARNIAKLEADPASGSQTYTGQAVQIDLSTIVGSLKATDSDGKVWKLNTDTLTLDDYTITDSNGKIVTGFPVNVGTYTFKINEKGIAALASANPDLAIPNEINGYSYTYTINQANAIGKLTGSNSGAYTGKPVTTAQVNSNGQIMVTVDYPGVAISNKTYTLKAGDYTWSTENGFAPTDAGKYTITLTKDGIANIENYIRAFAGTGQDGKSNVAFAENAIIGSATFEIVPKSITDVTISGNAQEKTYDGQAASLDVNDLTISATDLVTDSPLSMKDITASDFDWYDAQGKKLDAIPTDAGTYEARLKPSALQALQKANPNYSFNTASGMIKYTINQKAATDTLGGNGNKVYNGQETTVSDVLNSITWTPSGLVDGQSLDLSNLTADDYAWYTKNADGTYTEMTGLPTNAGTYYLKLKDSSIAKIQAANPNYSFATGAISGEYTYKINQANAVITLPNTSDQTITWTGNPATINPANFIPEITTDNPNEKTIALPSDLQLTASDYEFLQDEKVISAPSEVGTYQVHLSQTGWQKVQNAIAGNANYTWTYQGAGNYHIEKATATITLDGSASTTYTGNQVVIPTTDGVVNGISVKLSNGQTYGLKSEDLEFVDDQGNQIPVPTNAGSYRVRLTEAALGQIRKLENNHYNYTYNNDAVDFIVEKATADVTTSGSYDVVYNGQTPEINVDKITNTISTNNGVNLTAPTLSAGDYEWVDKDGKVIANPVNVGTYYLKLKDSSQSKIATNNNYTWNFRGLASVIITKANATISFGGSQETTYTGSVVAVNPGDYEVKLSNGQTYQLTDKDIQVIGSPINIGTYKVELSQAGIDAIKATDSNYNYSYDGSQGLLAIIPAKATATLSGSQTTQDLELDPSHYTVVVNGQTITRLTTSDFIFSKDGHPAQLTEAGTYDVELSGDAINQIRNENPNYDITFSSTATFTLGNSSQTINYVDADGKVISASSVGGKLKGNQVEFTPQFPVGWVASDPSSVPSEITLENGITTIKIKHGITNVDHTNPVPDGEKTPTGKVIDGAHENDLNQTITRTIVVTKPDGQKQTIPQAAKIYRDATYDNVTGEVTYGEWSTGDWKEFSPAEIKGYTVSEKVVPAVEVKNGQKNVTVNITYTANEQSGIISYQDVDGKGIGTTPLSGKTGETITITPEVPAGWEIVPGQDIPVTVTATADGIPTVVIKIKHGTTNVDHTNPVPDDEKTVTGEVIDGAHENDLNQTITRTIVVTKPDGTKNTEVQTTKIYREATYDNVTGKVTYGEWSTAKWDAYTPETIPGYTVNENVVPEVEVKNGQKNVTVNITYTANEQSGKISYQDADGKEIGSTTITGKTSETITITPEIPAGWQLVSGQEIPKTVTVTSNGIPTIIVKVEHGTVVVTPETPATDIPTGKVPGNPSKNYPIMEQLTVTPTRTINIKYPSGEEQLIPQKVTFTRTAIFDEVTGEIKYTEWLPQDTAQWASYQPTTVTGYVPSQKIVPAMTVNPETPNETVDITYDKIPEPQEGQEIISYQDANGQVIHTQTVTGEEDSDVSFKPEVPTNWQPTGDLPHSVKITGGTTVIVIEPVTVPVQEHKTVTRIIVEHLPSGDKQTVQTVVLTGTGTKNLVTGEVTDVKWDHGKFAVFTPATVPGYTTNMRIVPEMDVTAASGDSIVEINYIPNEQTGFIIYRDENGNEITRTALQSKTGEAVAINPVLPAGWELVPGQSIPAIVMTTPDGIPDVVILIKHQMITVKPGEKAPTGKVPGNPSTTYEKMESLTKEITRTITVKLSDGQRQIITQTVKFTRTATFDAVTGKATYSAWQVDGSNEWPAYPAPEINGYTASQVSIPAELVIPSDENQSIEIEYTKNNQPVEPDKPVTPITPDQPTAPTNPDQPVTPTQPAQPTEPSVPAKPIAPTNNGDKVMSGNQLPTEPVEQEKQQVSNQHFISHQLTQTSSKEKSKANILPQTGNDQNSGSILGFAFVALASILGLTGLKKKKREK